MSTVNIVMATYNGEKYIREQIDSILASTYTDWSLTICDDVSTDGTVSIVKEYIEKYPERIFLYENKENKGSNVNFLGGLMKLYKHSRTDFGESAKELGFSSNRAKYFMFTDQDDVWLKDKIELTLEKMKQLEKKYGRDVPGLVYTDAVVVDSNLKFATKSFHKMTHLDCRKNDLAHLLMENKSMGCTIMMNAALVERVTEIPEQVRYHDWWVMLIAAAFGHVKYYNEQTLLYRQHGNNQVGSLGFGTYCRNRLGALGRQKLALQSTIDQAASFLKLYGDKLNDNKFMVINEFAHIKEYGFFKRRKILIKRGFLKSGLIRNIGLMLII